MTKEKVKKPKCKGVWKSRFKNGVFVHECTKCGQTLPSAQGRNAVNHVDVV